MCDPADSRQRAKQRVHKGTGCRLPPSVCSSQTVHPQSVVWELSDAGVSRQPTKGENTRPHGDRSSAGCQVVGSAVLRWWARRCSGSWAMPESADSRQRAKTLAHTVIGCRLRFAAARPGVVVWRQDAALRRQPTARRRTSCGTIGATLKAPSRTTSRA